MSRDAPIPEVEWVTMAATLMTPHDPVVTARALKQFIRNVGLPAEALTHGSLDAVCSQKRRMSVPAFDEVAAPLREWWKDAEDRIARSKQPRIEGRFRPFYDTTIPAPRAPPTEAEKAAVAETVRAIRMDLAAKPKVSPNDLADRTPAPRDVSFKGERLRQARLLAGIPHLRNPDAPP